MKGGKERTNVQGNRNKVQKEEFLTNKEYVNEFVKKCNNCKFITFRKSNEV